MSDQSDPKSPSETNLTSPETASSLSPDPALPSPQSAPDLSPEPPGPPLSDGSGQIPKAPPQVTFVEDLADPEEIWKLDGGQPNTLPQMKGRRKVIKGNPLDKKHGKRMTQDLYDALWEAWRDGIRNKTRLTEMFPISWDTLTRVLDRGYEKQGWKSIKARGEAHDAEVLRAKVQAQAVAEAINSDEFKKARADNLKLVGAEKALLAGVIQKAQSAVQKCKFTKTKKTRDKEGKIIEVEVDADAFEMADALKTIVSATRELGQFESFVMGGPSDRTETTTTQGPPMGWAQLSPEQLQWIVDNSGELPPGITEQMLKEGIPPHVLAAWQPTPTEPGPTN